MVLVNGKRAGYRGTAKQIRAFIVSDDTPNPLPTDGTNVDGMVASEVFAPFSIIYVVGNGTVYIADESGEFVEQ